MPSTLNSTANNQPAVVRSNLDTVATKWRRGSKQWLLTAGAAATIAASFYWVRSIADHGETAAALDIESAASTSQFIDSRALRNGSDLAILEMSDLPELRMSPEAFASSASNPFSCSPIFESKTQGFCDWKGDHRVARSLSEARWMARRGYPTLAQRQMALTRDLAGLEAEAARTGSPALWALVLERRIGESRSAQEAEPHWRLLNKVAEQGKSAYALEQAALARLHLMQLEIVESGGIPEDGATAASIELQLDGALRDAAKLAILGDPGAMSRIVRAIAADAPIQHRGYADRNGIFLAGLMVDAYEDLRRVTSSEARGVRAGGLGFSIADIQPRPIPILVNGKGSDAIWVGE